MKEILEKIKPSNKEEVEIESKVNLFINKLKDLDIKLGGSYAKNTWLSGNHDIDIFALYKEENNISDRLENSLKKSFRRVSRVHGSRDYFQIKFKNLNFEVVPVLKIKKIKDAKNTTDSSPFHVDWIKKHTNKKLCDDIRLVKQFCKAQRVYGAETYIKGFSGHVLEILTIHTGSFKKCLEFISKVKPGFKLGKGNIKDSKKSALIIIDPIDKKRNAAAALSLEKLNRLKEASDSYLQNPSNEFFKEKEINLNKKLIIKAWPLKGKRDYVGTKLLKAFEFITKEIKSNGFKINSSDWIWTEEKPALFYYDLEKELKDKLIKHFGPPLEKKEDVIKFKEKYLNTSDDKKRIYTTIKRKYTHVETLLKDLFKQEEVKNRVKKIKLTHP